MGSTPSKPWNGFPLHVVDPGSRILWWQYGGDISMCTGSYQAMDVTIMCYTDTKLASDEYHLLRKLQHPCVLRPSELILNEQEGEWSYMRISNQVFTWRKWLDMKRKEFYDRRNSSEDTRSEDKRSWWNFIKSDFKKIFRDYIQAFWYIYHTKIATLTSLTDALFVKYKDGVLVHGLMKPQKRFGDTSRTTKDHLKEFRGIMMRVIGGELFGVQDVCEDKDFELEAELVSYLKVVLPFRQKRSYIHPSFILDSPFFWDTTEKIDFTKKMVNILNWNTLKSYHIFEESFTALDNWGEGVPHDTIFWSILNHLEDENKEDENKVVNYDHERGVNIHRFIFNCFESCKTKGLNEKQILLKIEEFLPHVYWMSIESLLLAVEKTSNYAKSRKVFEILTEDKVRHIAWC